MSRPAVPALVALSLSTVFLATMLAACGDGGPDGACGAERSLEMLAPMDGERVAAEEVEIVLHACNFDLADRIVVKLLRPFETDYAFVMSDGPDSTITRSVPVLPGTMEFRAQTEDGTVSSASVTIEGAPP